MMSNKAKAISIFIPPEGDELIQAKALKQREGRYTVAEAILILQKETGEYFPLNKAVESGAIPSFAPGSIKKITCEPYQRSLDEEVYWDDVLKWLTEEYPRINNQNLDTVPFVVKKEKPISVQRQQDNAILNWLIKNKYDPLKLPVSPPGKAGVRKLCKDALLIKGGFFSSESVFKTAWDRLRANKEIISAK